MNTINKFLIFSLILFVGLTAVSAADIIDDDSSAVAVETPQVDQSYEESFVQEPVQETDNIEEETQTYTGRTYNNPITITPSNYGTQMSNIYSHDAVEFSGTFDSSLTNGVITITSPIVFTTTSSATFEDTQFVINSDDVTINGLTIVNDDGTNGAAISATGYNNIEVINNDITITKTTSGETIGIKFNNTNNQTIHGNDITMNIYPQYRWEVIESTPYDIWIFHLYNSAIVVDNSYDVDVKYNTILSTNATTTEYFGTNEGINIRNSYNVDVNNNEVTINGGDFSYALTFEEVTTSNALNNVLEVNSENYGTGIQMIEVTDSEVSNNNIDVTSINTTENPSSGEAFGYGIYMSTNWDPSQTTGNTVTYNTINIESTIGYGIEGYIIDDNNINYNTINMLGNVVMGIGLYNSSDNHVDYNTITIFGTTSTLSSSIYEQIPPQTTGIKIVGNETSTYNYFTYNTITVIDSGTSGNVYAIILEDYVNDVSNNHLTSINNLYNVLIGDNAVNDMSGDNLVEDNV